MITGSNLFHRRFATLQVVDIPREEKAARWQHIRTELLSAFNHSADCLVSRHRKVNLVQTAGGGIKRREAAETESCVLLNRRENWADIKPAECVLGVSVHRKPLLKHLLYFDPPPMDFENKPTCFLIPWKKFNKFLMSETDPITDSVYYKCIQHPFCFITWTIRITLCATIWPTQASMWSGCLGHVNTFKPITDNLWRQRGSLWEIILLWDLKSLDPTPASAFVIIHCMHIGEVWYYVYVQDIDLYHTLYSTVSALIKIPVYVLCFW